jgi:hypothetical protein
MGGFDWNAPPWDGGPAAGVSCALQDTVLKHLEDS